jgi:hypothetical protein
MILSTFLVALFAVQPIPPPPLETAARTMLSNFNAEQFEAASKDFTAEMRKTVTPQVLAEQKKQMEAQVGKFVEVTEVRQRRADAFRMVELIAKYEKASVSVQVVFDMFNRIGAAYFDPIKETPIDPALEAKARELVANFTAGRYDAAAKDFAPALRAQLPVWRLTTLGKDVTKSFGRYRSIASVRQRPENGLTVLELVANYDQQPARIWLVFNLSKQVAGMHVSPIPPPE